MITKTEAIRIARELFPCELYGTKYSSYESLSKKDRIARIDLIDHIVWGEPLNQGCYLRLEE